MVRSVSMALVYVSSSYRDLREYRRRVAERLRQLGHLAVGMEADGASEHPPLVECLRDVRRSEAYVGILGFRYGTIPPGQALSYTELEYEEAGKRETPARFLFLATQRASDYEPGFVDIDRTAIDSFRARVAGAHSAIEVSSPGELATEVEKTVRQKLGVGRSFPPILPYLCNRQAQLDALQQALARRIERRPVLFVIHGDSRELHHRLVERVRLVTLREALGLGDADQVHEVRLRWPETTSAGTDPDQWFTSELARSLQLATNARATLDDLLPRLSQRRAPVLVSTRLEVTDWSSSSQKAVRAFAKYWERAPDYPSDLPLVVCLSVVYPPPQRSWWPFRKSAADRVSLDLQDVKAACSNIAFELSPRLGSDSVSRQHVENWISVELARRIEGFSLDEDGFRREIDSLFFDYESTHRSSFIPMGIVAERLKKALELYLAESRHQRELFS